MQFTISNWRYAYARSFEKAREQRQYIIYINVQLLGGEVDLACRLTMLINRCSEKAMLRATQQGLASLSNFKLANFSLATLKSRETKSESRDGRRARDKMGNARGIIASRAALLAWGYQAAEELLKWEPGVAR